MKECNATYKLSIQFSNWTGKGDVFQYPFGDTDHSNGDFLTWYYLHYAYPQLFPNTTYCEFYNPISYLASTNKIVDNNDYVRNFKKSGTHRITLMLQNLAVGYEIIYVNL